MPATTTSTSPLHAMPCEQIRPLIDGFGSPVVVIDVADDGSFRFLALNARHEAATGLRQEALAGRTPEESLAPETAAVVSANYARCVEARQPIECEEQLDLGRGPTWWRTALMPLTDPSGRVVRIVSSAVEISRQKETEQARRNLEERYRQLYNNTPAMIHSINRRGSIIAVSDFWLEAMGYRREAVLGRRWTDFLVPEARARGLEQMARSMEVGAARDVPYQFVKRGGEIIDVLLSLVVERNERGEPTLGLAVVTDVTARLRAEREAEASRAEQARIHQRLVDAIESMPDGFVLFDSEDRLVMSNQRYREMYAKSADLRVPGARYEDIVREAARRGQYREVGPNLQSWVAKVVAKHNTPGAPYEVTLEDGRCLRVTTRRTAEGGIVSVRTDITSLVQAQERLLASEQRLAIALEGAREGVWDWNLRTGETYYSARAEEILGVERRALEPMIESLRARLHPEERGTVFDRMVKQLRARGENVEIEHRLRRGVDEWIWVATRAVVAECDGQGRPLRIIGIFADVTERKLAKIEVERLALHDALTGLPNRVKFRNELEMACARARRTGLKVAVMFLDLDRFKPVNDALGHAVGDQLLIEVARRLEDCVRKTDVVARLGGDEFAVIASEQQDPEAFLVVAERMIQALAEPFWIGGHEVKTGASVGVTIFPDDPSPPDQLVVNADMALYAAKRGGRGRWHVFASAITPPEEGLPRLLPAR